MFSENYTRWSGLALLVGGILLAITVILTPNVFATPNALATTSWAILHVIMGIGLLLILFGLVGWYGRQADTIGGVGLVGSSCSSSARPCSWPVHF